MITCHSFIRKSEIQPLTDAFQIRSDFFFFFIFVVVDVVVVVAVAVAVVVPALFQIKRRTC